jgi:hypothetical protein
MRTLNSLMASGAVSAKAGAKFKPAILSQTRAQKTKMAKFTKRDKDEGSAHKKAEVPSNHISHPTNQRDRIGSTPSAPGKGRGGGAPAAIRGTTSSGGQARGGTVPTRKQIDQGPMQGKKWIPGGGVSAKNPKTGNTRMKGTIANTGGLYGGGGRDTQ